MTVDPITLAVVQNGLNHIADEMDLVHQKASFSPIISESFDRANGLYHRDNGDVIAQGRTGLPTFVGVMQFTTQALIERRLDFEPGDVFIVNDPYLGGTHLMDVKTMLPFFYKGKLWCHLTNSGHWPDIGGMVPGGFAASATEIQQEGLRLPPVKLMRRGELVQDVVDIILSNIRVPSERIGDIRAQVGALHVGARSLTTFLDKYGPDTVDAAVAELRRRSEEQMRRYIRTIPEGTYSFASALDSDGVDDTPLTVHLDMTVRDGEIHFDLSKSSPPCRGPMNSVWAIVQSAIYIAMKHVFPDVPINAGCFAPLKIKKPVGTFLYAEYPKPVSGCAAEVSQRLINVVFGAIGQARPDLVIAGPCSSAGNLTIGGHDPLRKRSYVMVSFSGGGYGGSVASDGLTNGSASISACKTQPVEILEQRYPVLFEEYALRENSGGAGERRGGFGIRYKMRLRRGEATAGIMMEGGKAGPHGLLGGAPGALNEVVIHRGETEERLPHVSKGQGIHLTPADVIEIATPGGGGYGPPSRRDRAAIEDDLRQEYVTPEQAKSQYGQPP